MVEAAAFCVTPATDFVFSARGDHQTLLSVNLPDSSALSTIGLPEHLAQFRNQDTLLWLSAGGCYVLNNEWVPLVRRSRQSPTNPGRVTISSGRSDSTQELYEPALVFRELFEEIAILTGEGRLIIPDLQGASESWRSFTPSWIERHLAPLLRVSGIEVDGMELLPARVAQELARDEVQVWRAGCAMPSISCLIHHVAPEADVNLLAAIDITLGDHSPASLRFVDLETAVNDGVETPLGRDIYLFHVPTRQLFANCPDWWDRKSPVDVELTSHAAHLLERICQTRERAN